MDLDPDDCVCGHERDAHVAQGTQGCLEHGCECEIYLAVKDAEFA